MRQLTRTDLRRLVIRRQHLDGAPRPPMLDVVRDLGCLQLDPISAVERSHLLVLWSRLGHYDPAELDRLLWEDKTLFEYWAHAASIVLTEDYPVHLWRMRQYANSDKAGAWLQENDLLPLKDHLLELLKEKGAMLSRDMQAEDKDPGRESSVWYSSRFVPRVLDHLWSSGDVMIVNRKGKQRVWGLTEDFLPEWAVRDEWDDEQITRYAVQKAVRALGAATAKQIKYHYTRNRYPKLNAVIKTLVKEGILQPVEIVENGEPLKGEWVMHRDDVPLLESDFTPKTTLLSPFDNLICDRERTEQLFDFYFRIEIYVPKDKREYGYYVLPILHGDQLIGRIDPRMDRKTKTLHVHNVYAEENAPDDAETVNAIREAITDLGAFLGAETIEIGETPRAWRGVRS